MLKNNKWIIGLILVIIVMALIASNTHDQDSRGQLIISDKDYIPGIEGSIVGPNTNRVTESVIYPEGLFDGKKPSVIGDFFNELFGKQLFSFVDLQTESQGCYYKESVAYELEINQGSYSTGYICDAGDFVQFRWGSDSVFSEGSKMFADLWEKIWGTHVTWDDYYTNQHYGETYTYDCYDCSAAAQGTTTCTDSDGGIDEDVFGVVHVVVDGSSPVIDTYYDDVCGSVQGTVQEQYCDGDDIGYQNIYCPSGVDCVNGRCDVSSGSSSSETYMCMENDGGSDFYTFSTTTLKLGSSTEDQKTDFCTGDVLTEYYCTSSGADHISTMYYQCDYGCDNGICLANTGSGTSTGSTYDSCATTQCVGGISGDVYCFDSNNDQTSLETSCSNTEDCNNGLCVPSSNYDPCLSTICSNNDVHCVDSDGLMNQAAEQTCGSLEVCNANGLTATCDLVECISNSNCGTGICMPDNTCGCNQNNDCGTGNICDNSECVNVECTDNNQCSGEICLQDNTCGCTQNTDCSGTSVCNYGSCVAVDCLTTNDCSQGELCQSNVCQPVTCINDGDCNPGICFQDNTCGCTFNSQCGSEHVCDNGLCNPVECTLNTQCEAGSFCTNNTCSETPTVLTGTTEEYNPFDDANLVVDNFISQTTPLTDLTTFSDYKVAFLKMNYYVWGLIVLLAAIIAYFLNKKKPARQRLPVRRSSKPKVKKIILQHKKSVKRR